MRGIPCPTSRIQLSPLAPCLLFIACPCRREAAATRVPRSDNWKKVHADERAKLAPNAMPATPWSSSHALTGLPHTERVEDLVNLIYARHHAKHFAEYGPSPQAFIPCSLIIDVSQDARRHSFVTSSVRSMVSGSIFYNFCLQRALCPWEHLQLLGWNRKELDKVWGQKGFSLSAVRDLAGESMACPCIALVTHALLMSMGGGVWR